LKLEATVKVMHWIGTVLVCGLIPSCLAFGQRVRVPEGTPVRVRLKADLMSDQVAEGTRVDFEVARPVILHGMTVISAGAVSWGAVQSVKSGKFIKFDIEGVQLPDGTNVKLRSLGSRAKNPGQDQIKVYSSFRGGVGAPKGTEYTAYVAEGREVAISGQPASSPALAATSVAAPTTPLTQAATMPPAPSPAVAPTAPVVTPTVTSTPPAAAPAVTPAEAPPAVTPSPAPATAITPVAPVTAPASSPGASAAPVAKVERVMVQCFSDPSGADILIDGDFYGNTPSILKLPVGKHELEIQLSGYKTYAIPLILQSDTAIRTIHPTLEQKE
jgi:hypothetical protein